MIALQMFHIGCFPAFISHSMGLYSEAALQLTCLPSINQSSKQAINQSIDRSINQSINQSTNQSINQSITLHFLSSGGSTDNKWENNIH